MIDLTKMKKDEKIKYIFSPDPKIHNSIRFDWITSDLLGDLDIFLREIEINKGGGTHSVPILSTTALEFISALYSGWTKAMTKADPKHNYNASRVSLSPFP